MKISGVRENDLVKEI